MTTYVDRDELRRLINQNRERWMDRGYVGTRLLDVLHILDAMPVPSCETCKRGEVDLGADRCLGTMLKEASMCNMWEAQP